MNSGNHQPVQHPSPSAAKLLATMQARAALQGWTLTAVEQDGKRPRFVARRLAMTRMLPDVHAVMDFLRTIEVPEQ